MMPRQLNEDQGIILPIVLILTLALMITGLVFISLGSQENSLVRKEIAKRQAFYLAEAGIEKVVYHLFKVDSDWREYIRTGMNRPTTEDVVARENLGDGHYEVTIKLNDDSTYCPDNTAEIESIGFVKDAIRKVNVKAYVINHIEDNLLCLGGIDSGESNEKKKPKPKEKLEDAARNGNIVFMAKYPSTVMVDGDIHSNNEIFFTDDKKEINGVNNVSLTGSSTALQGEEPQVEKPWFDLEKHKAWALEEQATTGIKHVFTVQEFNDLVKNTPIADLTGTVYVYVVDGPSNIYDEPSKEEKKKFELKLEKKGGVLNIKNGSLIIDIPGLSDYPGYYRDKGKLKEIKIKVDNNLYINANSEPLPYQPALMSSGAMMDIGTSQLNIKGLIYTPTLFELKTKKRKKGEESGTGNVYITGAIAAGGIYIEHETDKDIVSITYNQDYIPHRSILQWTEGP